MFYANLAQGQLLLARREDTKVRTKNQLLQYINILLNLRSNREGRKEVHGGEQAQGASVIQRGFLIDARRHCSQYRFQEGFQLPVRDRSWAAHLRKGGRFRQAFY